MRRPGRRKRKARALEALAARGGVRMLLDPQVEAGLRVPLGGWWTTRGSAWRKSRKTSAWGKGVRVLMVSARSAAGLIASSAHIAATFYDRWAHTLAESARDIIEFVRVVHPPVRPR